MAVVYRGVTLCAGDRPDGKLADHLRQADGRNTSLSAAAIARHVSWQHAARSAHFLAHLRKILANSDNPIAPAHTT